MSNYVRIGTSIPDILSIANELRGRGESLTSAVNSALSTVDGLDVPSTFPPDQFSDKFNETYTKPLDVGQGKTMPAHEAVKDGARKVGPGLVEVADFVTNVMWGYQSADEQGALEIDQAGGGTTGT